MSFFNRGPSGRFGLPSPTVRPLTLLFALGVLIVSIQMGQIIGRSPDDFFEAIQLPALAVIALLILRRPYIGLALTLGSLPITELLPRLPFATSLFPVLGGLTTASYILSARFGGVTYPKITLTRTHIFAIAFVVWMFISNPTVSWLEGDRTWMFTFIQLLALVFLTGILLREPRAQETVMWLFALSAVISGVVAIQEVLSADEFVRGNGFLGGANTAVRYFVVAMIFLFHLRTVQDNNLLKLLITVAIGVLALSAIYTFSRTGFVILMLAMVLLFLGSQSLGGGKRLRGSQLSLLAVAIIVLTLLVPEEFYVLLDERFLTSVQEGTDTVGIRYNLWQTGLNMWFDHPIAGVGIGQFGANLGSYGIDLLDLDEIVREAGAHNAFVQVLAETGIVGLGLFLGMLWFALRGLWRGTRSPDGRTASLALTWFVTFVALLVGWLTMHTFYDKVAWACIGMATYFETLATKSSEAAIGEQARASLDLTNSQQRES
ncbi:MAG: hypothetical protein GYB67_10555 [Chloroflexi bacterium]|nr:hypothetical protein [Chloroflexota bacterium]